MFYEDRVLTCCECGAEFVFSAGEQAFFAEKGLTHEPTRCRDCRRQRKQMRDRGYRDERQTYTVSCATCGLPAQVPFKPTGSRPVYCRECLALTRRVGYR
jgi:CxxC-x17-CxxC domain-containing protein